MMDAELRAVVDDVMNSHNIMTLATLRADGFPQATTVGYVHDGLDLYFACDAMCQKARNIARDPRVSFTIDHDYENWGAIKGLSAAGLAEAVTRLGERGRAERLMLDRFPQFREYAPEAEAEEMAIIRVRPTVISVLDYTKGFGHTDLVHLG